MKEKFESLFRGLYIYDNPTKNKNNYYVLNFNFSGLTIDENDIVESGKKAFYNVVRDNIIRFVGRYDLEITLEGDTASDLLRNKVNRKNIK